MKVAYFVGTLNQSDGVTNVLRALIEEEKKLELKSLVVTSRSKYSSILSIPSIKVPSVPFPFYKDYRIAIPEMKNFEKHLDKFNPDIIHLHSPDTIAWVAIKYAQARNIPIIVTHHTNFVRYADYYHLKSFKPFIWWWLRKIYNQAQFISVPSSGTAHELCSHRVKNINVIPWGVNLTKFSPEFRSLEWRSKINRNQEKIILLCACRLVEYKDLDLLSTVSHRLRHQGYDFSLVVVGDGPLRHDLKNKLPEAFFTGFLDGQDLSTAYASSDILFFPSSTETFGNVIIEGMASGLIPVIADAGGGRTFIRNGENGFLAKPQNSSDFAVKISKILENPQLITSLREEAIKSSKKFLWPTAAQKIFKLYQKAIRLNKT